MQSLLSGFRNEATAGNRPIPEKGQNTMTSRNRPRTNTYSVLSTAGPNQPGPSDSQRPCFNPLRSGELCYGPRDSSKRGSSRILHNVTSQSEFPTPSRLLPRKDDFVTSSLLGDFPPEMTRFHRKLKVSSSFARTLYPSCLLAAPARNHTSANMEAGSHERPLRRTTGSAPRAGFE